MTLFSHFYEVKQDQFRACHEKVRLKLVTYMLQFSKNFLRNAILVELGFYGIDDIVYHSTVDSRLKGRYWC